jgi:hypothetical protein
VVSDLLRGSWKITFRPSGLKLGDKYDPGEALVGEVHESRSLHSDSASRNRSDPSAAWLRARRSSPFLPAARIGRDELVVGEDFMSEKAF